jgi:hypothetical protein
MLMKKARIGILAAAALTLAISPLASAQNATPKPLPKGAYAKNVEFVSFTDNGGHIPFKMSLYQANGRWYMYVGAQNDRGWSVLDVTDPANTKFLNWIPGPANTRTVQVDIADGKMITGLERSQGGGDTDPTRPWDDGVLIWGLGDPVHPELLGHYHTGGLGTHRNGYQGGRYMYLSAGANGYSGNIFEMVDISDPAHAFEVSRWALPELKLPDPKGLNTAWPHGHGLHGPPVIVGNLAYLGFDNKMVILDISDVKNPKEVSELQFDPPYHLLFAVHTVLPFPSRKIVETNSEGGCEDGPSQASLIDVADPAKPKILSFLPVPVPPPDAPYKNFCQRSGGFGAHNVNMLFHNPSIDHSDNILYMTYTNAGLRVFDIADARLPKEIGYFVPPDRAKKPGETDKAVAGSSNGAEVIVDTRGYIYMSDRSQGIWVLKYTGPKPGPAIPVH